MSTLLLRSVLHQCCRRAYQPVMPLIQIPKRQYLIVPEPDEIEEGDHEFFQDWHEIQRELIESTDQSAAEFGSDPYPSYRKVDRHRLSAQLTIMTPKFWLLFYLRHSLQYSCDQQEHQKRTEARFQGARKRNGRVSIRKVRGIVDLITFKRETGYR